MTAIELKTALVNEIMDIEDETLIEKTLKAVRRTKTRFHRAKEEGTISKGEILAGIAEGLREVRLAHEGKIRLTRLCRVNYSVASKSRVRSIP